MDAIHLAINFSEAPLYLPEVVGHYQDIRLVAEAESKDEETVTSKTIGDLTEIHYPAGRETRPYMRFKIAREIAKHFFRKNDMKQQMNWMSMACI